MANEAPQAVFLSQPGGFAGPPAQDLPSTPEGVARRYDSSTVVRRWGATLIDYVLLGGSIIAVVVLLPERLQPVAMGFLILAAIAYFPVFEHLYGRTLGKTICRLRIVNASGGLPSWSQAILRTLLRVVEVNPLLLGGIPAGIIVLTSKARQRLGDIVAGTFVLRAEDLAYLNLETSPGVASRPLPPLPPPSGTSSYWLLPTHRSGWAIAAGYLGLFALLLVPAPFALLTGILALRDIRRHPGLGGKGRAVFGIVMGVLCTIALIGMLIGVAMESSS